MKLLYALLSPPPPPHLSVCTICVLTCDRCDRYTNVPPYCVLVKDPTDQCCMKPLCTPPVTQSPHPQNTQSPPGVSTLKPPQQGTVSPPINPQPTQHPPLPTSLLPTPAPREYTVQGSVLPLLDDSGGVVNSLDVCPASLKSLGCFYFRCVLSSQWKAVTVNLRILHCQL